MSSTIRSKADEVKRMIDQLVFLVDSYKNEQDTFKKIDILTKIHDTYGRIIGKLVEIVRGE